MTASNQLPCVEDAEGFLRLPEDCRREAVARMAYLVGRGASPDNALNSALDTMLDDESEQERRVDWTIALALTRAWPVPSRTRDGRPDARILEASVIIDGLVEAALENPTLVIQPSDAAPHLLPDDRVRKAAQAAFTEALAKRRQETGLVAPEPAPEPARPSDEEAEGDWMEEDDVWF